MKRLILLALAALPCLAAYAASPFLSAFMISEAIKAGDTQYLEHKIEWPAVRQSLRESLLPIALGTNDSAPAPQSTPGFWARFKANLGRGAVNRFVDRYVTPAGLPTVFTYGTTYRKLRGHGDPPPTLANLPQRMQATWSRMKRCEFLSPTLVEIEMESRETPERHFVGQLQLQDLSWRLVSLRVKLVPGTDEQPGNPSEIDDA